MANIDSLKLSITQLDRREALAVIRQVRESRASLKQTINRRSPSVSKAVKERDKMDKMINQLTPEMARSLLDKLTGGTNESGTA